MEIINQILQPAALPIDIVCIVLVLLSGLWQHKYLSTLHLSGAWKTLIVSFVVCALYVAILMAGREYNHDVLKRYFFSYFFATSLYELLLKKTLQKWLGE